MGLTADDIVNAEKTINRLQTRIKETYTRRHLSREADEIWMNACKEFYSTVAPTDYLWADDTRLKIRAGDRQTIGDALLFLEVDPWHFRSGYLKERLLDCLKQAPLTDEDAARIRRMIIARARGPSRREFSRFCKIAIKVDSDEFESELKQIIQEQGYSTHGKLSYLVDYLKRHRCLTSRNVGKSDSDCSSPDYA